MAIRLTWKYVQVIVALFRLFLFRNLLVGTWENHETPRDKLTPNRDVNPESSKHEFAHWKTVFWLVITIY
jgi:hypothetical protein